MGFSYFLHLNTEFRPWGPASEARHKVFLTPLLSINEFRAWTRFSACFLHQKGVMFSLVLSQILADFAAHLTFFLKEWKLIKQKNNQKYLMFCSVLTVQPLTGGSPGFWCFPSSTGHRIIRLQLKGISWNEKGNEDRSVGLIRLSCII